MKDTGIFIIYANKRLTSMTATTTTASKVECALMCMSTDGCLVSSVTTAGGAVSCNLATGSSEENALVGEVGSEVFVFGKSIKRWIQIKKTNLFDGSITD